MAILKTEGLTDTLRAAVVRVLSCVYVDADPQANIRIPMQSRLWDEVTAQADKIRMPGVEHGQEYNFFLLQDYIWDHLEEVESISWEGSTLKLRLMELLHKLVQFRFYSDPNDVIKIIHPLVKSLDCRCFF